MNVNISAK